MRGSPPLTREGLDRNRMSISGGAARRSRDLICLGNLLCRFATVYDNAIGQVNEERIAGVPPQTIFRSAHPPRCTLSLRNARLPHQKIYHSIQCYPPHCAPLPFQIAPPSPPKLRLNSMFSFICNASTPSVCLCVPIEVFRYN
jgi:hypothetical protein